MKNKIAIHYGCFVTNWMDDQFPLIRKIKDLGFETLEFGAGYLVEMSSEERKKFRDAAEEAGIDLVMSLGLTPTQDIGSPDATFRADGLDVLRNTARAMAEVGATDCSGIIYGAWNGKIADYSEKAVYWKNSVATMKEAIKTAEDSGVRFNVEVVNRFENPLINTCDEALEYLSEVGSPNLGIHLDTFHMNIEEDSMVSAITKAGDKLGYFHIGENNRKFPGLGTMPWKIIFDALEATGYEGPIGLEAFVKPGGEVGSAVSLYRELMDVSGYDEDLRQSLRFVRNFLG